jgi:hypothetical protein
MGQILQVLPAQRSGVTGFPPTPPLPRFCHALHAFQVTIKPLDVILVPIFKLPPGRFGGFNGGVEGNEVGVFELGHLLLAEISVS